MGDERTVTSKTLAGFPDDMCADALESVMSSRLLSNGAHRAGVSWRRDSKICKCITNGLLHTIHGCSGPSTFAGSPKLKTLDPQNNFDKHVVQDSLRVNSIPV